MGEMSKVDCVAFITAGNSIALANASAEQARADAESRVANAALAAATTRVQRAEQACERICAERDVLGDETADTAPKSDAHASVEALQKQLRSIAFLFLLCFAFIINTY